MLLLLFLFLLFLLLLLLILLFLHRLRHPINPERQNRKELLRDDIPIPLLIRALSPFPPSSSPTLGCSSGTVGTVTTSDELLERFDVRVLVVDEEVDAEVEEEGGAGASLVV